jgi:hypothetical protein
MRFLAAGTTPTSALGRLVNTMRDRRRRHRVKMCSEQVKPEEKIRLPQLVSYAA